MQKPLTLSLFTSIALIALAAMGCLQFLAVDTAAYAFLQFVLAAVSVGGIVHYISQRALRRPTPATPLLGALVVGVFSVAFASANAGTAAQLDGPGCLFARVAMVALVGNAFLCLYALGELDDKKTPAGEGG